MTGRPDPVKAWPVAELPLGTRIRWANGDEVEMADVYRISFAFVEVVKWPTRKVPWHQAFTERLPLVELRGEPISDTCLTFDGKVRLRTTEGRRHHVDPDGMVEVAEPDPDGTRTQFVDLGPAMDDLREALAAYDGAGADNWLAHSQNDPTRDALAAAARRLLNATDGDR